MRILVYGAGVLGGNLANSLYRQGKNVTLLARGSWYEEIKRNGNRSDRRICSYQKICPVE